MKALRQPKPRRRNKIKAIMFGSICIGCTALGLHGGALEALGTLLASKASAESTQLAEGLPGLPDAPRPENEASSATTTVAESDSLVFQRDPLESLAQSLKARERALDEREQAIKEEERRLEALRAEVEQKLARSEQVLKDMEKLAGNAAAERDRELGKWIKIYQAMPPQDAGKMMAGLETEFARELLAKMDPKKAGKILSSFPKDKAIEVGQQLGRQGP